MTLFERISQWATLIAAIAAAVAGGIAATQPRGPAAPGQAAPVLPPAPPKRAEAEPNPREAIGRIQFGSAGCSGTVIGPRRTDGKYWILTAAHCLEKQPTIGMMQLRNGSRFSVERVSVDGRSDCAWLLTCDPQELLPFALLATDVPRAGSKVWHAGFGVHVPGNVEEGEVISPENADGQTHFSLSVSSGDSGGGICLDDQGRVVSCVCCTTARGQKSNVWGASIKSIIRLRDQTAFPLFDWEPLDMPIRR